MTFLLIRHFAMAKRHTAKCHGRMSHATNCRTSVCRMAICHDSLAQRHFAMVFWRSDKMSGQIVAVILCVVCQFSETFPTAYLDSI
jgi:hypothetical protein